MATDEKKREIFCILVVISPVGNRPESLQSDFYRVIFPVGTVSGKSLKYNPFCRDIFVLVAYV